MLPSSQNVPFTEDSALRHFEHTVVSQQLQSIAGDLELGWSLPEVGERLAKARKAEHPVLLSLEEDGTADCCAILLTCVLTSQHTTFSKANALASLLGPVTRARLTWLVSLLVSLSVDQLPRLFLQSYPQESDKFRAYLSQLSASRAGVEAALLAELIASALGQKKEAIVRMIVRSDQLSCLVSSSAIRRLLQTQEWASLTPVAGTVPTLASTPIGANAHRPSSHFSVHSSDFSKASDMNKSLSSVSPVCSIKESLHARAQSFLDDSLLEHLARSSATPRASRPRCDSWDHCESLRKTSVSIDQRGALRTKLRLNGVEMCFEVSPWEDLAKAAHKLAIKHGLRQSQTDELHKKLEEVFRPK